MERCTNCGHQLVEVGGEIECPGCGQADRPWKDKATEEEERGKQEQERERKETAERLEQEKGQPSQLIVTESEK